MANSRVLKDIDDTQLKDALDWLFNMGFDMERLAKTKKQSDADSIDLRTVSKSDFLMYMNVGSLYSHIYDPKLKDELPFYDVLPLYFPIDFKGDRMLALNIHYLPPMTRKMFIGNYVRWLDGEAVARGFKSIDNVPPAFIQKVGIEYLNDLYTSGAMQVGGMLRQCVRTYLYSHIMSDLTIIKVSDWGKAVNAILPQFVKKSDRQIYRIIRDEYDRYLGNTRKPLTKMGGF
jgi:hypothetical protein